MKRLDVGFVGTRNEITYCQKKTFKKLLKSLKPKTFHHRDQIGTEEWAHEVARGMRISTVVYPPINPNYRAFCEGDIVFPPDKLVMCGRKLVFNTDVLIAIPRTIDQETRTVLWETVRFAAKSRIPIYIINIQGEIDK